MIAHRWMSPQRPSRVVVLGATGFVGSSFVRHATSLELTVIPLGSADVDLCSPASVAQLKQLVQRDGALVMTSALTPDKGRDARTLLRNLTMGEHLSAFLRQSPCAHVIYVSSDAVYADGATPVRERSCASPTTFHGLMHLTRERMLSQALHDSNVPLLILRPCALYGPGDTHNGYGPMRFLRSALHERTITLFGQGEERRDHVYIDDVSRLVALCLARRSEGTLNVATGRSISFSRLAKLVVGVCREPVRMISLPRQMPVTHRHFDTTELVRAFPTFQMTPLEQGLAATVNSVTEPVMAGRP